VKGRFLRLRATKPKPGKLLTRPGMCCGGGLVATWISAATWVNLDAAAGAWVEAGSCEASPRVYKGEKAGGDGIARANHARFGCARLCPARTQDGRRPRPWAPPVGETKRGTPMSATAARREEARCLLGSRCAGAGPRSGPRREKGERGQAGRGEREKWAEPKTGRGRRKTFYLSFFQLLLKSFEKDFQNQFEFEEAPLNKIYAAA